MQQSLGMFQVLRIFHDQQNFYTFVVMYFIPFFFFSFFWREGGGGSCKVHLTLWLVSWRYTDLSDFFVLCSGYDFGYLIKILSNANLPEEEVDFFEILRLYFPVIYDVKYLMKSCKNLKVLHFIYIMIFIFPFPSYFTWTIESVELE